MTKIEIIQAIDALSKVISVNTDSGVAIFASSNEVIKDCNVKIQELIKLLV